MTWRLTVLLLVVAVACATRASAYVRSTSSTGVPLWWQEREVPILADAAGTPDLCGAADVDDPECELAAIRASVETWRNVNCQDGPPWSRPVAHAGGSLPVNIGAWAPCSRAQRGFVTRFTAPWGSSGASRTRPWPAPPGRVMFSR